MPNDREVAEYQAHPERAYGHAICVVGYSDPRQHFIFKNSWGEDWGDDGYGYIPYSYMSMYSWDAWTSVDVTVPVAAEEVAPESDNVTEIIIRSGPASSVLLL